jgi:hypothetical protein
MIWHAISGILLLAVAVVSSHVRDGDVHQALRQFSGPRQWSPPWASLASGGHGFDEAG